MPRRKSKPEPQTLREVLESYTVAILKKLAKLVASNLPTRKAELVDVILKELGDDAQLRQLWNELDETQQAAVAEVVHSDSTQFNAGAFHAKYGKNPEWGESRWGEITDPSLLRLFIYNGKIPRDLSERLSAFVPPPRTVELRTTEPPANVSQTIYEYEYVNNTYQVKQKEVEIPVVQRKTAREAEHDVHAVLRLIDAGKVRASSKTKRVSAAGARAIAEVLQGGDFYPPNETDDEWITDPGDIKAFAWPLLVQSAKLASVSGTKLQLTSTGKKALAEPPHEAIQKIWKRWLKTTIIDEFNRIYTIKGQTGKGKRKMTAVASRREAIVNALTACSPYEWIAFAELSRFMRASGYKFEVSRDLWSLYISDSNYGSLGYAGFGEWHIVQERYMLAFLFEYAATLGLIDVAYIPPSGAKPDFGDLWGVDDLDCLSRYDGLLYFRINELGAWCLGQTTEYTPIPLEEQQTLKVLPNMDVVATERLSPGDVLFLEQFAEQTANFVWKIDSVKLLKALEQGHKAKDIAAFLEAKSGTGLPNNVAVFFQETADRVTQLVDRGTARLIEANDPALAQLIAKDRQLRAFCMLAGDRYIAVPVDSESAFRRALRDLGYVLVNS